MSNEATPVLVLHRTILIIVAAAGVAFAVVIIISLTSGWFKNQEEIAIARAATAEAATATRAWEIENATETPSPIPTETSVPTPTVTSTPAPTSPPCAAQIGSAAGSLLYSVPSRGRTIDSVELGNRQEVSITGRIQNELWYLATVRSAGSFVKGVIPFNDVSVEAGCPVQDLSLADAFDVGGGGGETIIADTFFGFNYEWANSDGEQFSRVRITDDVASLELTNDNARLLATEPLNFHNATVRTSVNRISEGNNSYIAIRFVSTDMVGDPQVIEVRFKRRNCEVVYYTTLEGREGELPAFPLGNDARCSTGDDTFIEISLTQNPDSNEITITGIYNDTSLPNFTVRDEARVFNSAYTELVAFETSATFEYIMLSGISPSQ